MDVQRGIPMTEAKQTENPYEAGTEDQSLAVPRKQPTRSQWLVPTAALGTFVFLFVMTFVLFEDLDRYMALMSFTFAVMIALPFYAILLIWLTWKRFRDGTNRVWLLLLQLISFAIPAYWVVMIVIASPSPV